jgi:hypothetical protein
MGPVIYTTYGIAMGHRPEVLAASGGLQPVGVNRMREQTAQLRRTRVRCWLETVLVRMRLQHQDAASRTGGTEGMSVAVLPSTR